MFFKKKQCTPDYFNLSVNLSRFFLCCCLQEDIQYCFYRLVKIVIHLFFVKLSSLCGTSQYWESNRWLIPFVKTRSADEQFPISVLLIRRPESSHFQMIMNTCCNVSLKCLGDFFFDSAFMQFSRNTAVNLQFPFFLQRNSRYVRLVTVHFPLLFNGKIECMG